MSKSNQPFILLLRHAKAVKNLEIRYGGKGSELLPEGYEELERLVAWIRKQNICLEQIITTPRLQCEQTAQYLATALDLPYEVQTGLVPAHIGLISGMALKEVEIKYPDIAAQLKQWRTGQCEIHELKIPGMVAPEEYYEHIQGVLAQIIAGERSVLVVGSLSILIALANILLGRHPRPGGNYRAFPWNNTQTMCFCPEGDRYQLVPQWSTVNPAGEA